MLKSDRLILKTPTLADAPDMAKFLNRKDTAHMMSHVPHPYTLDDAQNFITRTTEAIDDKIFNGIYDYNDNFMGIVSIIPRPNGDDIGYWLGREYWGNGFMTEACSLTISEYFATTGKSELFVSHFLLNDKSKSVVQKLGFEYVGNVMLDITARKTVQEAKRYRLTKQQWQANHA